MKTINELVESITKRVNLSDFKDSEVVAIKAFLDYMERYQHNSVAMSRGGLVNAWRKLPESFRAIIGKRPNKKLTRGADGVSTGTSTLSFTAGKTAGIYGSYVFGFDQLERYEGIINTADLHKVTKWLTKDGLRDDDDRAYDIGNDEDEVIVVMPQWKKVVVDNKKNRWEVTSKNMFDDDYYHIV